MTWTPLIYYYCPFCGRSHSDPDAACCGEKGRCTMVSEEMKKLLPELLQEARTWANQNNTLFLCNVVKFMEIDEQSKEELITLLWNYARLAAPEVMEELKVLNAWLSHIAIEWDIANEIAFRLEWLQQMIDGTLPEDMRAALTDRKEYLV